jgi:hypothetical protein
LKEDIMVKHEIPTEVDPGFEKDFRQLQRWRKVCEHLSAVWKLLEDIKRADPEPINRALLDDYLAPLHQLINGNDQFMGASAEFETLLEELEGQAHDEEDYSGADQNSGALRAS